MIKTYHFLHVYVLKSKMCNGKLTSYGGKCCNKVEAPLCQNI